MALKSKRMTAKAEDVLTMMRRFRDSGDKKRLEWAIEFAQEDLEKMTPGRIIDLRIEIEAFAENARTVLGLDMPEEIELFTDSEIREARLKFRVSIKTILDGKMLISAPYKDVRYYVGIHGADAHESVAGTVFSHLSLGAGSMSPVERAEHEFIWCLGKTAHLFKECSAPMPRSKTDERCGRWFVIGRRGQNFCSPTCQNRASTQVSRRTETIKKGIRIRATSTMVAPNKWVAGALLLTSVGDRPEEKMEILFPKPAYFKTREEADVHAHIFGRKEIAKTHSRKARRKK